MLQRSRHYPRPSIKSEPITSTFVSSRFFSSSGPVTAKKPAERPQSTASETLSELRAALKQATSLFEQFESSVILPSRTDPLKNLPHLAAVRSAVELPVTKVLPLLSPTLDAEVFRKTSTCSVGVPHHEVLEWIGDRELNSAAALVVAVMSPTGVVQKDLGWHSKM